MCYPKDTVSSPERLAFEQNKDVVPCPRCGGFGWVVVQGVWELSYPTCDDCAGTGEAVEGGADDEV